MRAKGVNQSEVAKTLGFQSGTVSRYFQGESVPKAFELLKLARYFGVSMEWLLVGDESRDAAALRVMEQSIPYKVRESMDEKAMRDILNALESANEAAEELRKRFNPE